MVPEWLIKVSDWLFTCVQIILFVCSMGKDDDSTPAIKEEMIEMDEVREEDRKKEEKKKEDGKIEIKQEMVDEEEKEDSSSSSSGSSSDASSEVIFEDNGDYIETNLISAEDLK